MNSTTLFACLFLLFAMPRGPLTPLLVIGLLLVGVVIPYFKQYVSSNNLFGSTHDRVYVIPRDEYDAILAEQTREIEAEAEAEEDAEDDAEARIKKEKKSKKSKKSKRSKKSRKSKKSK